MSDRFILGVPSKGRLKDDSAAFFAEIGVVGHFEGLGVVGGKRELRVFLRILWLTARAGR